MKTRSVVVTLALLAVIAACQGRAAEGKRCKIEGRFVCGDATTALFCFQGIYRAFPCRGARGCTGGDVDPYCDDRDAIEGEACMPTSNDGRACAPDRTRALVCRAGRWEAWHVCRGARACSVVDERVECDATIADVGDACASADAVACASDGASMLACERGAMAIARACGGERGCLVDDARHIECDDSVAREGDRCAAGATACSVDRTAELACKGGRFVRGRACARAGGCAPQRGARPLCDADAGR